MPPDSVDADVFARHPRPWRVSDRGFSLLDARGNIVTTIATSYDEDAALIVAALNAYESAWVVPSEHRPTCPLSGEPCSSWTCLVDVCDCPVTCRKCYPSGITHAKIEGDAALGEGGE